MKTNDMKNLISTLAFLIISISALAQNQVEYYIQDNNIPKIQDSVYGIYYRDFGTEEIKDLGQMCEEMLHEFGIDYNSPDFDESTMYVSHGDQWWDGADIALASGDVVKKNWIVVSEGEGYGLFLIMSDGYIEFTIEQLSAD